VSNEFFKIERHLKINHRGSAPGAAGGGSEPNPRAEQTVSPSVPSSSRHLVLGPLANLQADFPRRATNPYGRASLTGMPPEIRSSILGDVDGPSGTRMARVSTGWRADVIETPKALQAIRSSALMVSLETVSPDIHSYAINNKLLVEIRACAPFLTTTEAQSIVKMALTEGIYGFTKAPMLGALLSGCSDNEAEDAAEQLDALATQRPGDRPQDDADKIARGKVLVAVLGSIGIARLSLYEPFLARLSSNDYDVNLNDSGVASLSDSFPNMPELVRDDLCAVMLDLERGDGPSLQKYANTLQMFFGLRFLSPPMQDAVFLKAKAIYEALPAGDKREEMVEEFCVGYRYRDEVFEGLSPSIRDKWKTLLP